VSALQCARMPFLAQSSPQYFVNILRLFWLYHQSVGSTVSNHSLFTTKSTSHLHRKSPPPPSPKLIKNMLRVFLAVHDAGAYNGMEGLMRQCCKVNVQLFEDLTDENNAIDRAASATLE
jgi:hypothetical protein